MHGHVLPPASPHRSEDGDTQKGHRHRKQRKAKGHDQVDLETQPHDRAGARQDDLDPLRVAILTIRPVGTFCGYDVRGKTPARIRLILKRRPSKQTSDAKGALKEPPRSRHGASGVIT
jgi:hypothetical protein